ncbi:MAG: ATP-dependent helicase HrpB [Nitrospira sp.]|nr:ATP-dependent helicase HrpB [Nitrospira sp.]
MNASMVPLPIVEVLPLLRQALRKNTAALVIAPPGAGKSTVIPLTLLDEPWLAGKKLLLLEPRRLATRTIANHMASLLGEQLGETVGYRMRFETAVGPHTRIEVVTEGVLTKLLRSEPDLSSYGAVLFDEFHERSVQADMGLALTIETQRLFRPDLRIVVMSATLDDGSLGALLGHPPVIRSEGKQYQVATYYLEEQATAPLDIVVTQAIRRSLACDHGSVLVFLPGMADIRWIERRLIAQHLDPTIQITPLHGDLPPSVQNAAIQPSPPGKRKIVLATSIAETSLTIEGIRVVIDSGWMRVPRFDPRTGLTNLATVRITQDSADQRRGRAGRSEPGVCYRLWTEQEHLRLIPHRQPEIFEADLAPLLLELAAWGANDPLELPWLTPPPAGALAQAKEILLALGALNKNGHITSHGRKMAELPLHPRLSHMVVKAGSLGCTSLACQLAVLLNERDILIGSPTRTQADLRLRLDILHGKPSSAESGHIDQHALRRLRRTAHTLLRQIGASPFLPSQETVTEQDIGRLLALAYPDRIAQRQKGPNAHYLLVNGRGARFSQPDPLATEPYLVIASLVDGSPRASIELAAPVTPADIESLFAEQIVETEKIAWNDQAQTVTAVKQRKLGALVLAEQNIPFPDPSVITATLLEQVRQAGLKTLAWTPALTQWKARVEFLRRMKMGASAWPDMSDEALLRTIEQWLGPFLHGLTSLKQVQQLDIAPVLLTFLTRDQQRELDQLAPTHITVPSGSLLRIDYESGDLPILRVQIQEVFGWKETPRIAGGAVPLTLHLLSPAKRPVQITQDLAGFWARSYREVRKELRSRYPKHHWPDDPLTAVPTSKTKQHASFTPCETKKR